MRFDLAELFVDLRRLTARLTGELQVVARQQSQAADTQEVKGSLLQPCFTSVPILHLSYVSHFHQIKWV